MNAGNSALGQRNNMDFGPVEKAVKGLLAFFAQPHSKLLPLSMFCFLGESEGFHTRYFF